MTKFFTIILALICATLHAQTVIVKGTGAGNVRGTGAGSVRGVAIVAHTDYCDGRFTVWDANTNVVDDNDSGLTWTRDANIGGQMDWTNAVNYCDNLTNATYTDWRLASITEFSRDGSVGATNGLVDAYPSANDPALPLGHPFINVQSEYYWLNPLIAGEFAWAVNLEHGYAANVFEKIFGHPVWPCRGP